jgi:hypothetical protein
MLARINRWLSGCCTRDAKAIKGHIAVGQQRSAIWVKAVRRHAKAEGIVINSIQTSFVSERMLYLIAVRSRRRS